MAVDAVAGSWAGGFYKTCLYLEDAINLVAL